MPLHCIGVHAGAALDSYSEYYFHTVLNTGGHLYKGPCLAITFFVISENLSCCGEAQHGVIYYECIEMIQVIIYGNYHERLALIIS